MEMTITAGLLSNFTNDFALKILIKLKLMIQKFTFSKIIRDLKTERITD